MTLINEVKFSDLNNQKKTQNVKDMQRAAHSQGYDMSDPKSVAGEGSHFTVDLTHRKTGKKVPSIDGGNLGGAKEKSGKLDNTLRNKTAKSIKAHAKEIGRVDKRPAAKAKRKEEASANKEKKAQNRDPFTRQKTFEEFMAGCLTSD
tara:strand:- start:115 stop:555 length:441 start_codon:yes stop_codon:yes gene_type:complete